MRLRDAIEKKVILRRRALLERAQRALVARHPKEVLARTRGRLNLLHQGMASAMRARLRAKRALLADASAKLNALSPLSVLARGYSIVTTSAGIAVRDAGQVGEGEAVSIRLSVGRMDARVEKTYPAAEGSSEQMNDD
jgi:exodeoxyribonuclease VII large subunit